MREGKREKTDVDPDREVNTNKIWCDLLSLSCLFSRHIYSQGNSMMSEGGEAREHSRVNKWRFPPTNNVGSDEEEDINYRDGGFQYAGREFFYRQLVQPDDTIRSDHDHLSLSLSMFICRTLY